MRLNLYKTSLFFAMIYLSISPVYWMPSIDESLFSLVKTIIFFCAISILIKASLDDNVFNNLYVFFFFLLISYFSFIGFYSDFDVFKYRIINIIQCFLFSFSIYCMAHKLPFSVFRSYFYIFFFISLSLIFLSFFLIFFSSDYYVNPYNPSVSINETGFGGTRTGWSIGLAIILPWLILIALKLFRYKFLALFIVIVVVVGNQYRVAGRSGLTASVFILIFSYLFFEIRKERYYYFTLLALGVILIISGNYIDPAKLRFDRLDSGLLDSGLLDSMDHFSTGRISQYLEAIDLVLEKPILGWGFGNIRVDNVEIHNAWLRQTVEGGIPFVAVVFLFMFYIVIRFAKSVSKLDRDYKPYAIACLLCILGGFIGSMFEPGVIFGAFNNSAFFWFSIGLIFYLQEKSVTSIRKVTRNT